MQRGGKRLPGFSQVETDGGRPPVFKNDGTGGGGCKREDKKQPSTFLPQIRPPPPPPRMRSYVTIKFSVQRRRRATRGKPRATTKGTRVAILLHTDIESCGRGEGRGEEGRNRWIRFRGALKKLTEKRKKVWGGIRRRRVVGP